MFTGFQMPIGSKPQIDNMKKMKDMLQRCQWRIGNPKAQSPTPTTNTTVLLVHGLSLFQSQSTKTAEIGARHQAPNTGILGGGHYSRHWPLFLCESVVI